MQTIDFKTFIELYGAIVGNDIDAKTSVIFGCTSTCTTSDMPYDILVKVSSFFRFSLCYLLVVSNFSRRFTCQCGILTVGVAIIT